LATKLRKEFIKLLEKDPEFRQTVAGYLGLAETLKNRPKPRRTQVNQTGTAENMAEHREAVAGSQGAEAEPDEALGKHGEALGGG
jgi:hypothetical protein